MSKRLPDAAAVQLRRAVVPIIETLEGRRLMALNTIQALPFALEFNSEKADSLLDKDGQGIGLTRVQENKNATGYQAPLIDLVTSGAGTLNLTTTGTSAAGTNYNGDNTLVNALETQFDATTNGFKITTRLIGPLSYISTPSQQGGIMFGPDQNNYVKLVAVSSPTGQFVQFTDEQTTGTTYSHTTDVKQSIGAFANVNTLDLQLVGNASTGTVEAYYAINGGGFVKMSGTVTIQSAKRSSFFNAAGRAGVIAAAKNDQPPIVVKFDRFAIDPGGQTAAQPSVTATRPANGQTNVPRDSFVAADVHLPTVGASIDSTTLNATSVSLYRTSDHSPIAAVLNTSGGGDAIVLTPIELLDENTSYTFEVNSNLKDLSGASFQPYTATFTTGTAGGTIDSSMAFVKVPQAEATGKIYTAVTVGPDKKLYAATLDGLIQRFTISADGTLGPAQNITSLQTKEGGPRLLIGMAFDASGNLWVSHSQYTDIESTTASDFTGKISKLSGANYATVTTMITNLPRSVKDHATNQLVFGPDGALYFAQGSNTAMGEKDSVWGNRPEHMLNAAVLRVDISKLGASPLDVKTTDAGGTYNPFAANAALTIYATGVRNAYDLVWANGKLFAATNGSAAGGNTPATPPGSYSFGANQRIDFASKGAYTGPNVVGLTNVQQTQNDYIFTVVQGGYYGHPNPVRGEFVMNGGNPTAGVDPNEVPAYPVGTLPDRNYRGNNTGSASLANGTAYVYGKNYSPDGIFMYQGTAFSGLLNNKLLVAEYSGGDAIGVLTTDSNGNITKRQTGIAGLTHFIDPLDITEDIDSGFLYVAEFGGQQITLLRPITPGAHLTPSRSMVAFNDTTAAGASPTVKITITNTGTSELAFPTDGLSITGTNASQFAFVNKPNPIPDLDPGESFDLFLTFTANSVGDIKTANLQLKSNDGDSPTMLIPLRGLGTSGTGGANEPSLQKIMDLYQIPINVGDNNPGDVTFPEPPITPNNELVMPRLVKADNGPVTIEPLAIFGVGSATVPTFRFGTYTPGNPRDQKELLYAVGTGNSQTVDPQVTGITTFDPGTSPFGIYTYWQNFQQQPTVWSEDSLNTAYDPGTPRKVRFYPLKTAGGTVMPNAFIFTFDEFNTSTDMQDFVGIIRNVTAAPTGPELGLENLDGVPYSDRLVFNRIQDPINTDVGQPNNIVHDKSTLRLRNTGSSPLTINSLVISSGWIIENAPSTPFTIQPGDSKDLSIKFTQTSSGSPKVFNGTLVINSNDADEPTTTIALAGHWQPINEKGNEPSLQQIVNIFGLNPNIPNPTGLNQGGKLVRVADEVISGYWKRADTSAPMVVRQLAAYHTQGSAHTIQYYAKGSSTKTTLFTGDGDEGQSLLPHTNNGSTGVVGTSFAQASASPGGFYGFYINGEYSDNTKNTQENSGGGWGHHLRFFVVRDKNGVVVPNTYILTMDFSGINYDYQDNVFLVTNIAPETGPSIPAGLTAAGSGVGNTSDWTSNTEPNLAGYNVYRATTSGGTYVKVNSALIATSDFIDSGAPIGTSYYKVTAVDTSGNESAKQTNPVSATRGSDTSPPANPSGLTATATSMSIKLDWQPNNEADFNGFNVYRSTNPAGPWGSPLNGSPLTNSDFTDSTAPVGVISYYKVTAKDDAGNESTGSFTSATRPSNDVTPPAAPTLTSITPDVGGILVNWSDNSESDFAGYNIERSLNGVSGWTKLNASLLSASQYNDTTAPTGVTSYYRISALDTSSNPSSYLTTNAIRPGDETPPAVPTGLVFDPKASGIILNWADNQDGDLAGYKIYRSSSLGGQYDPLNGGNLVLDSTFTDTTAPVDVVSYYRITAVDQSNNESAPLEGSATRPAPDLTPPAAPAGLIASANANGITLNWDDNSETDLDGYNVYRSSAVNGVFTKVNGSPVEFSIFLHSSAPTGESFYYIKAVDTSGNESDPSSVQGATRTASYTFSDIGSPGIPGSLQAVGDTGYDLSASGSDIYGTSDNFGFAYQQVTGDFDMKVRLASLSNVNALAKAGLMARESLAANSRNAFAYATPTAGGTYRMTSRTATGGTTSATGSGAVSYPNTWIRLTRVGNTFTSYRSTDGQNWTQIGAVNIGMAQTVYFGLAAVSHTNSAATTAQFRDLPAASGNDEKPATPANLIVQGSESGIDLNWDDNVTDSDLVGYNVYRTNSAGGTFTKITGSPIVSSQYFDSGAPVGQTSYYKVVAVDVANQESEVAATGNALRPAPVDVTPPAMPAGLGFSPSTAGIQLNWTANTEIDLDGYDVFRSANGVDGWQQLNGARLTNNSYLDAAAPQGVESFYRVVAVDTSNNVSDPATGSSTRPVTPPPTNVKINFQLNGSPTVAGYDQDNGDLFGLRTNGLTYGFNTTHTAEDRDRNKIADQLRDTLVQMKANATWSINLANGTYQVKLSVGDSQYSSTNSVSINGVTYWSNQALGVNQFAEKTMTVTVTDGKLTLSNAGAPDRMTKLNYIEITSA